MSVKTIRFLFNMTHNGFFYLPGARCIHEKKEHDLDMVVCCDSYLGAVECKDIEKSKTKTKHLWSEIKEQLLKEIELSIKLRFDFFVFSTLASDYPKSLISSLEKATKNRIKLLVLNKEDLEKGRKKILQESFETINGSKIEAHYINMDINMLMSDRSKRRRKITLKNTRSYWG